MESRAVQNTENGHNTPPDRPVTLLVGQNSIAFTVVEELLCAKVPFFDNAFKGNFVEAQTRTFSFPDDDPEDFQNLVRWLEKESVSSVYSNPTWLWLSRLWIFADKYHIDELQNEVVNTLHAKFATHRSGVNIAYETLEYVVDNTFERSPLRRLFVDMLTNGISLKQLPSQVGNIPAELLQEMVIDLKETIFLNNPTATALLTRPIETYYTSSAHAKATAMPVRRPSMEKATPFYCDGASCVAENRPMWDAMYICTRHRSKYCESCAPYHRGHRLKLVSLTSPAYTDKITGPDVTLIDGQINDSGFFCDGPSCDIGQDQKTHTEVNLMSGDRYHCLECSNIDYCSLCVRGPLECKDDGHTMLRIRTTFAKRNRLRDVSIPTRQQRAKDGACWRCASAEHATEQCEEATKAGEDDVEIEE